MSDDQEGGAGAFEREPVGLDTRITADGSTPWPVERGRYRLIVAREQRRPVHGLRCKKSTLPR
jgi:glutathionyl-hydroquinone reductase